MPPSTRFHRNTRLVRIKTHTLSPFRVYNPHPTATVKTAMAALLSALWQRSPQPHIRLHMPNIPARVVDEPKLVAYDT
ncbi:hypothetical protein M408DRAFT_331616 [Serendipita vermifera MAFF 305830]|uniref:Uncharacterized protein n=1 Tax=Serendipita vermifera MAFF 305830 TaxID=933852 RepID=A0A0C3AJL5_SERVB|nr:hypothetical protein M408DRAFT_331616 [Serendipita vermifera MAFF 305830]